MILDELLKINHVRNATLVNVSSQESASYELVVTRNHTSEVESVLKKRYGIKHVESDEFVVLSIASNKPMPVPEGNTPLVFSCNYRSTVEAEVNWYKVSRVKIIQSLKPLLRVRLGTEKSNSIGISSTGRSSDQSPVRAGQCLDRT